ncbi:MULTISPECIES: hypothetical protein [unclassified Streptomyces]|uniref:hypothetical protein n=1 Tax=unclassified Streptomyces TaxID=2593676 RepID=UPI00037D4FC0|nr:MULTISPECIES: hypothetical protein [unclassified Streptomyces]MYT27686.1 hypothetical protein [Streptomyces sp. SID8354]
MKPNRPVRRVAGTAATALLLAAGAVGALASPAFAKANSVAVGKVALGAGRPAAVTAEIAYSCDPGSTVHLAATATSRPAKGHRPAVATGTVANKKLVCDADVHRVRLVLHPKRGSAFDKKDRVTVAAAVVTPRGAHYADARRTVTL